MNTCIVRNSPELVHWPLYSVFMNNIFYFIEICNLTSYADDNILNQIASSNKPFINALLKYTAIK